MNTQQINTLRDAISEITISRSAELVITNDVDGNVFYDEPVTPRELATDLYSRDEAKRMAKKMRRIARTHFQHVKYARWHFSHAETEHVADEVQ